MMKPARSVEWTKEKIDTLATLEVRQLRANAERLNDPEIMQRCDAVLDERPRGGGPGSKKPVKTPATRKTRSDQRKASIPSSEGVSRES